MPPQGSELWLSLPLLLDSMLGLLCKQFSETNRSVEEEGAEEGQNRDVLGSASGFRRESNCTTLITISSLRLCGTVTQTTTRTSHASNLPYLMSCSSAFTTGFQDNAPGTEISSRAEVGSGTEAPCNRQLITLSYGVFRYHCRQTGI